MRNYPYFEENTVVEIFFTTTSWNLVYSYNTPRPPIPPHLHRVLAVSNKDTGFPLGLENLEKWADIFQSGKSQGILNRLEKSGKITQNIGKLGEFEINIIWYF